MTETLRDTQSTRSSRTRRAFGRTLRVTGSVVRTVCGVFALILVTHIVLTLFAANPDNWITRFAADWSSSLTLGLRNLFTPDDPKIAVLINYGIAAIVWLVIGAIIVRILRAVAGRARW